MLEQPSRGFIPRNDSLLDWLLVSEAIRLSELGTARAQELATEALERNGTCQRDGCGHYRLLMTLDYDRSRRP